MTAPLPVLVSTGLGLPADDWDEVVRELGRLLPGAPVVVVDRLGERAARPGPEPGTDPVTQVQQLADAALAAGHPGPYLLVGHSAGGLYAGAYARLRPDDVAGLVLVDSSLPERGSPALRRWAAPLRTAGVAAVAGAVGVPGVRASGLVLRAAMVRFGRVSGGDPLSPARRRTLYTDPRTLVGTAVENAAFGDTADACADLADALPLPRVPVLLVVAAAAGRSGRRNARWVHQQARRAVAIGARTAVLDDAGHLVMLDAPHRLAAEVAAVHRTASAARRPSD